MLALEPLDDLPVAFASTMPEPNSQTVVDVVKVISCHQRFCASTSGRLSELDPFDVRDEVDELMEKKTGFCIEDVFSLTVPVRCYVIENIPDVLLVDVAREALPEMHLLFGTVDTCRPADIFGGSAVDLMMLESELCPMAGNLQG